MECIVNFYELQNSGNELCMCQQINKVYIILTHANSDQRANQTRTDLGGGA